MNEQVWLNRSGLTGLNEQICLNRSACMTIYTTGSSLKVGGLFGIRLGNYYLVLRPLTVTHMVLMLGYIPSSTNILKTYCLVIVDKMLWVDTKQNV